MKRCLIASALPLVAMLAFASCAKPGPTGDPVEEGMLVVSPSPIQVGASRQTMSRQMTVKAEEAWEITSTPEWITTENVTETGFTVNIEPYIDGLEPKREGVIAVSMGETRREVPVTQLVYMIPIALEVSPMTITNVWKGLKYGVSVSASHQWEATTDADWLSIGDITETGFNITPGEYGDLQDESRTGIVTVTMKNREATSLDVTVIQPKPIPGAALLSEYLGEYTLIAEQGTGVNKTPYQREGELRLRSDIGNNILSIRVLAGEDGNGELCFEYDPVTGVLHNYNYETRPDLHRGCTFAFYTDVIINFTPTTAYFPVPAGELQFVLNDDKEIVFPSTADLDLETAGIYPGYTLDEGEKPCYVLDFYYASGVKLSNVSFTNAKLVKKQ
jgi:hypothetical protein